MRNYIILNDINSNTINGLLIQELPPISKPKMRTQIEEIDGRAGDIVTQLGYAAYTKTISVGLYGDFDINEVISYFNSSGTVVFSNEPDKYYNYEIIDQIDFNRLVRFRTAKVKMHVQPFKYPTEEEPLVAQYQLVTNTGSDMSLNNTANALFKKLDLKGNTSQDGTPTPDAPIPVNVVSGDNSINVCGKNLLNIPNGTYSNNGITAVANDGVITLNGTAIGTSFVNIYLENNVVLQNQTVTVSTNNLDVSGDSNTEIRIVNVAGTSYMECNYNTINNYSTKTNRTSVYDRLQIRTSSGVSYNNFILKPMLEMGSTHTNYEPYIGSTYPIYLGDIELCKIGDYQDYIYKENNKWLLHKEIGKETYDGTEANWSSNTSGSNKIFYREIIGKSGATGTNVRVYTNYFNYNSGLNWQQLANGEITMQSNSDYIFIRYDEAQIIGNFKTWLNTHNLVVYYILAIPTTTQITDEDLIAQLEALKQANSYDGQTNISHQYNGSPFILDVAAVQKGSDELVVDNEGNIYARPTIDLEGTGIVNIYLEGNQMFQVDLSENNEIVIDTDEMEAYDPSTQALMNRQVTGNYDNFKIVAGNNNLKFSGDLTKATVTNYERWL